MCGDCVGTGRGRVDADTDTDMDMDMDMEISQLVCGFFLDMDFLR